jgi:ATP-dependent exoDNAse (exonuclease V) beta subunit
MPGLSALAATAILLRAYTHADEYAAALRARGLQALVVGGSRFFGRPEVQTLRALCGAVANAHDDEALAVTAASPLGGLSDDALWLLRHDAAGRRRQGSLAEGLDEARVELDGPDAEAVTVLSAVLERARTRVGRMPLSEVLLRAVEESAWDLRLLAEGEAGRHAYANVLKSARLADGYEAGGGAGPAGFLEFLDAKEASGDHEAPATLADDASPCVRIMSIHASKGLEFGVVALPQLGDGQRAERGPVRWQARAGRLALALALPPDRCCKDGSKTNVTGWFAEFDEADALAEEEEAKRLFYVACTRAEEGLILTGATNLDGKASANSPLAWLLEAAGEAEAAGAPIPFAVDRMTLEPCEPQRTPCAPAPEPLRDAPRFPPAVPPEPVPAAPPVPIRLSYSDIALFRRCPRRFYAEKVLRLGTLRSTEEDRGASFGSAVHAALQLAVAGDPARDMALRARSFANCTSGWSNGWIPRTAPAAATAISHRSIS